MTRYMLGWVIGYRSELHGEFLEEAGSYPNKDALIFKSREQAINAAYKLEISPLTDSKRFVRGYCYESDNPKHAKEMKVLGLLKDFDTAIVFLD